MHNFWAFGVLAALAAAGCSQTPPPPEHLQNADSGGPDSQACKKFIATLPQSYFHDWISVPENPDQGQGTQIRVFYYGRLIPGKTPVVFFNGGPTGNSWGDFRVLSHQQDENMIYAEVPFVYIDQRGTGCSESYPAVQSEDDLARLALYGSTGIVFDAEAVREKLLGNAPWKVFGQSYGGMIVHRYVSLAPKSVTSAISHGFALTTDPLVTLTRRIESQYKVVNTYLTQYPEDQAELATLDQLLTPTLCFSPSQGSGTRCGKHVLAPLYSAIGFLDQWPVIHKWLAYMQAKGGMPQEWIDKVLFSSSSVKTAAAQWADTVIWHNEVNSSLRNSESCAKVYAALEAKGETPRTWYLNECQANVENPKALTAYAEAVLALPQNLILPDAFRQTLAGNPSLRFYLYSGEIDPYSPPTVFPEEVNALGALAHYTDFTSSGHNGFFSENEVWETLLKD